MEIKLSTYLLCWESQPPVVNTQGVLTPGGEYIRDSGLLVVDFLVYFEQASSFSKLKFLKTSSDSSFKGIIQSKSIKRDTELPNANDFHIRKSTPEDKSE